MPAAAAGNVLYMSGMAVQAPSSAKEAGGVVGGIISSGSALAIRDSIMAADARATPVKIDPSLRGRTGKLEVRIFLSEVSAAVLEQLKKLGFEIVLQPKTAKMVIGRIGADKLAELEKLAAVIYVAPMT
jgi:hypothetical protein